MAIHPNQLDGRTSGPGAHFDTTVCAHHPLILKPPRAYNEATQTADANVRQTNYTYVRHHYNPSVRIIGLVSTNHSDLRYSRHQDVSFSFDIVTDIFPVDEEPPLSPPRPCSFYRNRPHTI